MNLEQLGWSDRLAAQFAAIGGEPWCPARVVRRHGDLYVVDGACGELTARASGRLRHQTEQQPELMPALGDWVAVEPRPNEHAATIHALLPRFSRFSRKVAGQRSDEQVIAANIDTVLVLSGLDHDLNLRRLERYLTLVWNSGADPVIVLNKSDLCPAPAARVADVASVARGVPVLSMSAATGDGVAALDAHLGPGRTVVAVGSSGVGKSTLVNHLLGCALQATRAVRADDSHGRHTTTFGRLIPLPAGGVYIDTPGLREVQLWGDEDDVDQAFADIAELALRCRFTDCRHEGEPGCAVREAIEAGRLDRRRFHSYCCLQREMKRLAERQDRRHAMNSKRRWKQITRQIREHEKRKRDRGP